MRRININENFDKLPKKESLSRRQSGWSRGSFYKYKGKWCWAVAKRLILHYEGKPVNKAFSHYCRIMPSYLQKEFWDIFDDKISRYKHRPSFLVDDDANIKIIRQKSTKSVTFISFDYKTEINNPHYSNFNYKENCHRKPKWMKLGLDYFEPETYVVVDGFSKEFESKNSKEYKRLVHEDNKAKTLNDRLILLEKQNKVYCYLTREELKNKSNEDDIIDRNRFGFDENSFKGGEYHGQKRKKRKNNKKYK